MLCNQEAVGTLLWREGWLGGATSPRPFPHLQRLLRLAGKPGNPQPATLLNGSARFIAGCGSEVKRSYIGIMRKHRTLKMSLTLVVQIQGLLPLEILLDLCGMIIIK
jgi:hypothetical protein